MGGMIKELLPLKEWVMMAVLTLMPFLELRASIPYGIIRGHSWWVVFAISVVFNILLAPLAYFFWYRLIHLLRWIRPIDFFYQKNIERVQRKAKDYVDMYGGLGLALFIGIPLPGTGVWTGALAANIFGMRFRKYLIASVIGVLVAGVIVTILVVSGLEVFGLFVKVV